MTKYRLGRGTVFRHGRTAGTIGELSRAGPGKGANRADTLGRPWPRSAFQEHSERRVRARAEGFEAIHFPHNIKTYNNTHPM